METVYPMQNKKPKKPPTPPQPKPWDPPPVPLKGDPDQQVLFAAVGAALSAWESLEERLSHTFELLVSPEGGSLSALRAYGSILTFRGRGEMIKAAAEGAFFLKPDPDLPKRLKALIDEITNFATRRNEIAHGIIQTLYTPYLESVGTFLGRVKIDGYVIGPPIYATNKTDLEPGRGLLETAHHKPNYGYHSTSIGLLTKHFARLADETRILNVDLMGHFGDLA